MALNPNTTTTTLHKDALSPFLQEHDSQKSTVDTASSICGKKKNKEVKSWHITGILLNVVHIYYKDITKKHEQER